MLIHDVNRKISLLLMAACLLATARAQAQSSWRENIALTGNLVLGEYALDVATSNGRAYVLTREAEIPSNFNYVSWISVIDIQNPARPKFLFAVPIDSFQRRKIIANENRVGVYGGRPGIDLVDFNSSDPVPKKYGTEYEINSAAIDGDILYLQDGAPHAATLKILDISDFTNPTGKSIIRGNRRGSVAARNGIVYFRMESEDDNSLYTYNVTNPAQPQSIDSVTLKTFATRLHVHGRLAFTSNGSNIEFTNIANPAAVFTYLPIYLPAGDVAALGSMAYLATGEEIVAIDTTDPLAEDIIRGKFQTLAPPLGIDTYGTYCVIACGHRGLLITNYTGPGAPIRFTQPVAESYSLNGTIPVQVTTGGGAGKAMRLELWKDSQLVKVLGTFWNPNGEHDFSIPAHLVASNPGTGFYLRAVGLWNTSIFGDSRVFNIVN